MIIQEAGRSINKKNESHLKVAMRAIRDALRSLGEDPTLDDDETTDDGKKNKSVKEAKGWSSGDLYAALARELKEEEANAYIQDIFDESVVYQKGWSGSYMQRSYTLDETGVATFGDPVEVSRKVTYVPTSDNEITPPVVMPMMDESKPIELISDGVKLVERAVSPNGEVMLKLISPGKGSSGFYSTEVLKQAANNKIFKKGLHNFIDHPTTAEEASRPEGSLTNLGSVLTEDAVWKDDYRGEGPGLYAPAKTVPQFSETLNTIADYIGTSIRANGKAHVENGQTIVDSITEAKSVDYVTLPGRGGKVLSLMESNRNNGVTPMTDEERLEMTRLREAVQQLTEQQRRTNAIAAVNGMLGNYPQLHTSTRTRLAESLSNNVPLTESGVIDTAKLNERITAAVNAEMQYLAQLGVGNVTGMGNSNPLTFNESDIDKLEQAANDAIMKL